MVLKLKHLRKETLQAQVRILEQEGASPGQEGPGELEPTESSKHSVTAGAVAPVLQAQRIVKRPLKHNQPVAPGGGAQGQPTVTELRTCTSYTPTELRIRKTKL